MSPLLGLRERLGTVLGRAAAPVTAAIASIRHARVFHPDGVVCTGTAHPGEAGPFAALGDRLAGPVLARFSAALWKGRPRWFDVLGVAVRFGGEQDLLFATIRSPFTMPLAPLTTRTNDYFANRYWAVSPFEVAGVGRLKFRLVPAPDRQLRGRWREMRLITAIEDGEASFVLEARRVLTRRWHPVAQLTLERVAQVDQEALRFDPFHAGRGIVPSGLVHAIRPGAYAGSQAARRAAPSVPVEVERPTPARPSIRITS